MVRMFCFLCVTSASYLFVSSVVQNLLPQVTKLSVTKSINQHVLWWTYALWLLQIFSVFQHHWIDEMVQETVTLVFLVLIAWKVWFLLFDSDRFLWVGFTNYFLVSVSTWTFNSIRGTTPKHGEPKERRHSVLLLISCTNRFANKIPTSYFYRMTSLDLSVNSWVIKTDDFQKVISEKCTFDYTGEQNILTGLYVPNICGCVISSR